MDSLPILAVEKLTPRAQHIYFIVESSDGMTDEAKSVVNAYIAEMMLSIADWEKTLLHVEFPTAMLGFGDSVVWANERPVKASDFSPPPIALGGIPDVGKAFDELNSKLRKKAYMDSKRQFLPLFILFLYSDHLGPWEDSLRRLEENAWFSIGIRVAINASGSASNELMERFAGNKDFVLMLDDCSAEDLIKGVFQYVHRLDDAPIQTGHSNGPNKLYTETRDLVDETWDWSISWNQFDPDMDAYEPDSLIWYNNSEDSYRSIQPYL